MMLREPWRTRLLFLSFAVNLVAVPMAASRYVMRHPLPLPPGAPPPQMMIQRITRELGDGDADKLRTAMEPHVEAIEVARVHMEAARREMIRAMTRPTFDRDAAKAAMAKWQENWGLWSQSFGDAMLDGFAGISPEAREHLREAQMRRRP